MTVSEELQNEGLGKESLVLKCVLTIIGMQYVSLSGEPHNALHSPSVSIYGRATMP